mmetsp:Transcript_16205/g.24471  ORF Transcript_16205/g.24471 Transcript_16205/m.24471 type:complete len:748 (-) Transcript_16205:320-2563(-)
MADLLVQDSPSTVNEDLLVPFRNETSPHKDIAQATDKSPKSEHKVTNKNGQKKKRDQSGRFQFFQKFNADEKKEDNPNKEKKEPLKCTTFAFPNAQVEHAEDQQEVYSNERESENNEDDDSLASDEEYEYVLEEVGEPSRDDQAKPQRDSLKNLDDWDPTENPYYQEQSISRNWKVEGFGSTAPPQSESESKDGNPVGRFLRRFRGNRSNRDPDLRDMKVATEDTKDDLTLTEKITKAALVVIAPEIYLEQEEGDSNKGMYRTIRTDADNDVSGSDNDFLRSDNREIILAKDNIRLKKRISKLETEVKTIELEVSSWKLRCNELEAELRRYRGQDSDDSSAEAIVEGESDSEDDRIEEEWTGYDNVKEGNLLGIGDEGKPHNNSSHGIENLIDIASNGEQSPAPDLSQVSVDVIDSLTLGEQNQIDPENGPENRIGLPQDEEQKQFSVSTRISDNLIDVQISNEMVSSYDPLAGESEPIDTSDSLQLLEMTLTEKKSNIFDPIVEPVRMGVDKPDVIKEDELNYGKINECSEVSTPNMSVRYTTPPPPPPTSPPQPPPQSPPPSPPSSRPPTPPRFTPSSPKASFSTSEKSSKISSPQTSMALPPQSSSPPSPRTSPLPSLPNFRPPTSPPNSPQATTPTSPLPSASLPPPPAEVSPLSPLSPQNLGPNLPSSLQTSLAVSPKPSASRSPQHSPKPDLSPPPSSPPLLPTAQLASPTPSPPASTEKATPAASDTIKKRKKKKQKKKR